MGLKVYKNENISKELKRKPLDWSPVWGVGHRLETSNMAEDTGNGLATAAGAGAQEE